MLVFFSLFKNKIKNISEGLLPRGLQTGGLDSRLISSSLKYLHLDYYLMTAQSDLLLTFCQNLF
jgi:hypothetical protein